MLFYCDALACRLRHGICDVNCGVCEGVVVYILQEALVCGIVALVLIVVGECLRSQFV